MKVYKVVPAAGGIVVKKRVKPATAIETYFDIINREREGGWEFVTVSSVNVIKKSGIRAKTETYNAFIFAKEDNTPAK